MKVRQTFSDTLRPIGELAARGKTTTSRVTVMFVNEKGTPVIVVVVK